MALEEEQQRRVSMSPQKESTVNAMLRRHSQSAANMAMEVERERRIAEAGGDVGLVAAQCLGRGWAGGPEREEKKAWG